MNSFLEYVAKDLLEKYGENLSDVTVVFPNKRASLFLNQQIAINAGKPIWSPRYVTISELFRSQTELTVADPIYSIAKLYEVYVRITSTDETIDHFWSWGQIMLSDFDDLDKNMGDAKRIFTNVKDLHELDGDEYLTDEQREMLKAFFDNFSDEHNSYIKERFLSLWSNMLDIYNEFNAALLKDGLAYEGALYRKVAENESLNLTAKKYVFIGFNLLQEVEKRIFRQLKRENRAVFYWDFDDYYMKAQGNEAGTYIREYLKDFPNELDTSDASIYNNINKVKDVQYVAAPTEDIQARYVRQWLMQNGRLDAGQQTAIVLADESLLKSVINCLPNEAKHVNITVGYPLSECMVTSVARSFINDHWQDNADTTLLLQALSEKLQALGMDKEEDFDAFEEESIFRMYTIVNRLKTLSSDGHLCVNKATMLKLLDQIVRQTTMPFHGEPVVGLQIMGVLETRNLDFDHILVLSCNEGNLPKGISDTSLIPHNIRKAWGMTVVENKVAIYAYYFYRLMQRAKDITLCYNNSTDDGHTRQMSRFMIQMMTEAKNMHLAHKVLTAQQEPQQMVIEQIEKDEEVMKIMSEKRNVSPSALCNYLRCNLLYYFSNIKKIKEEEDDEEFDGRLFGLVLHNAVEGIYHELMDANGMVERATINAFLHDGEKGADQKAKQNIMRFVEDAFRKEYFQKKGMNEAKYNGLELINREVICKYIKGLLLADREQTPFRIIGLEMRVEGFGFHGIIDRLDMVRDAESGLWYIRVIDYKTGYHEPSKINSVDDVFSPDMIDNKSGYYLQTMLYACIIRNDKKINPNGLPVSPALVYVQKLSARKDPVLKFGEQRISDIKDYENEYWEAVKKLLAEINDANIPFNRTNKESRCQFCAFKRLCG